MSFMKAFCLAIPFLLIASTSPASPRYTEKQVIAYAKSIDVKTLDPSLPSEPLEEWFKSSTPRADIRWTVSDTCDNKPSGNEDFPLCAKVWFSRAGAAGSLLIQVGRLHKGIVGSPQLYNGIMAWEEDSFFIMTGGAERLSELPKLLNQPAFAHNVGHLYNEVVAHHPVGIPDNREMAAIAPFLSKRLTEQLQTARACQEDYLRQRRPTDDPQRPPWLETGIFSGKDSRAKPASAWPVRKGSQENGSFLVEVNLFAQAIDLGNGLRGGSGSPGGTYEVSVKVISENDEFVVDDVRMFDGPTTEGPSHLLSQSFSGCNGPHWTGLAATK